MSQYIVHISSIDFWGPNELSEGGMRIHWIWKDGLPPALGSDGFGTTDIYIDKDGNLEFDKETMSDEFISQVLLALLKAEGFNVLSREDEDL